MRLGILGGTFDPIHKGHLALAKVAKDQYALDQVLFVPAFIPPHKADRYDITPAPYRYRMVEIAIRNYPGYHLSDIELIRSEVSYTIDTLRQLQEIYPNAELFLILGMDTLCEIPTWREHEAIEKMATFLVARRAGFTEKLMSPARIRYLDLPDYPVSSTQIREQIRQKKFPVEALPEGVEAFIRDMKIYQGNND